MCQTIAPISVSWISFANAFNVHPMRTFKSARVVAGPILFSVSILILGGCAASPKLDSFNRREIDRPYTLPEGVAAWHVAAVGGVVQDNSNKVTVPLIPYPLLWETALSD